MVCHAAAVAVIAVSAGRVQAERERFDTPHNGSNLGVWRITNDPTVRTWANYHNTQCWSPDGRYLCYTNYGYREIRGKLREHSTVHIYGLASDKEIPVDSGHTPRWANRHNWLIYVHENLEAGPIYAEGAEVRRFDPDDGRRMRLSCGIEQLGETDFQDRWIYGVRRFRHQDPELAIYRIRIDGENEPLHLPEVFGSQLMPSANHPVFFTRRDHEQDPFEGTRFWYDLEGKSRTIFAPTIQKCHMSWLGNGEYLLLGNGLIRGRRWDEPFPSNLHILASVGVGDVSPCGLSGRYACGDSRVADLRSGDGWEFIHPLSIVCYPKSVGDDSGIYDADPKGSPDGTKVCFVSNYDLKDSPITHITRYTSRKDTSLPVASTEGFPNSGSLVVSREVIGYERKTPTAFEGITRGQYNTSSGNLQEDGRVTSFDARCLTDRQWNSMHGPSHQMKKSIEDVDSPLIRQRQTDVYVAVVRRPDRPMLRASAGRLELIPGEEHFETLGYHLLRDGKKLTTEPLPPAGAIELAPGVYRAVAVERSGLESDPSETVAVTAPARLDVLSEPPENFAWSRDRWTVDSAEVPEQEAKRADRAVREIVHRHDGVIHREWYESGHLVRRHDLGLEGDPIRRTEHADGRLTQREYYDREDVLLSRELFDSDGFITEWVLFDTDGNEKRRWEYDRGMPVREVLGGIEFVKQGDRFGYFKDGRFIETPRGSISR